MKTLLKILAVWFVILAGCERQVPVADTLFISGYEIQGKVTDRIGNPIDSVVVLLDYTTNPFYADTVITRKYFVTDPSVPIQAVAVNSDNVVVVALTPPRNVFGWFQATWNGIDSSGKTAPSGIYHIQYVAGGQVVYSYDKLVSGGQVAVTDAYGRYTIPGRFLPIDSTSVPYFSIYDSSYVYNEQISNDVVLTFVYPPRIRYVEQSLSVGMVTFVDVVFK